MRINESNVSNFRKNYSSSYFNMSGLAIAR